MTLYRVLDDLECKERWGINSPRPYIRQGLPSTVAIFTKNRHKGRVALPSKWLRYAKLINEVDGYNFQFTKKGFFAHAVGWHNVGRGNIVEQVTFSGNIVDVYRIEGYKAYIRCFYKQDNPPGLILPTPNNLHPIVQLFTTQFWNKLDMTTNGHLPRTFIIANSRKEELWIDVRNLGEA